MKNTKVVLFRGASVFCAIFVVGMACFPIPSFSQNCKSPAPNQEPVATFAGQPLLLSQISPRAAGQLQRLRQAEFELQRKAIEDIVSKRMLGDEAEKNGLTVEELLERKVDSEVSEATSGELQAYALASRSTEPGSSDDQSAIRESLRKARIKAARQRYIEQLRERAQFALLIRPPTVDVLECDLARTRGRYDALVHVVEFSDFSCPYCKQAEATLQRITAKYKDKVSLSYRDFPLVQVHPDAKLAAEASRCALESGKFWEYHDVLFASSNELQFEDLVEKAHEIGIDKNKFASCLTGGKHRSEVELDIEDGVRAGVQTTPSFFINGVFLSGAQPIESFEKIINQELAGSGSRGPEAATALQN